MQANAEVRIGNKHKKVVTAKNEMDSKQKFPPKQNREREK